MAAPYPKDAWQETLAKKAFQRESWVADANCVGHPTPAIFFPGRVNSHAAFKEARQVCAECPVWRDCLKFALKNNEEDGMWGGLSIMERRLVRRSDGVRKCRKCGLIRVFSQKAQIACDPCNSPRRKRLG